MNRRPDAAAILLAAGESRRMGGADKLFAPLGGAPVLLRSLRAFERSDAVDYIVVAAARGSLARVRELAARGGIRKLAALVEGGARRQDSAARALAQVGGGAEIVLVHDAARPLVGARVIAEAVRVAAEFGAAIPAVPVKDTIKLAAADMRVAETPPRNRLWAAQTPQAFRADILRDAHARVSDDATDDAAMVEAAGHPPKLFMGDPRNIKITAPEDLPIAEALLRLMGEDGGEDGGEGGAAI